MGLFERLKAHPRKREPEPIHATAPQSKPLALIGEGNALEDAGRNREALALYDAAASLAPELARAQLNRGNALLALGESEAAAAAYTAAIDRDPNYSAAHFNLGNAYASLGRGDDAVGAYRQALELDPQRVMARYGLGNALQSLGRYAEAIAEYRRVLQELPDLAPALGNLGNALQALGQYGEAIECYGRALKTAPDEAMLHVNLAHAHFCVANMLKTEGRLDDAIGSYCNALTVKPDFAEAHCNLGNVLRDKGRVDEAIAAYRKAIDCRQAFPEAFSNLGDALKSKGLLADSIRCYGQALALKSDFAEAHFALGSVFLFQDRMAEAATCFEKAVALKPEYAEPRWLMVESRVPAIYSIDDDPAACRNEFAIELDKLDRWFDAARSDRHAQSVRVQTPFYLAYQDENNRELIGRHGNLCARIMAAWSRLSAGHSVRPAYHANRPLRVGIVSQHFRRHSVWRAIVKGWFEQIDRDRFALHAFYLGTTEDQDTLYARSCAAGFVQGKGSLTEWVEAIAAHQLDVLIYPEIGMDTLTGQLASLRLAPVQVSTWGHPETTGLPTIDYYVSADGLEPQDAQPHYTERLVRLPGLGCYYKPYEIVATPPDLGKLGIDPAAPLFICPGTPFKYSPRHDHVCTEIARQLGHCQFVFFDYDSSPELSAKLRQRMGIAFARAGLELERFVVFVPWQTPDGFFGLLERADVFLDTIGFSGFNTAMQAIECALPIVTCEGRFLRGRLASGILRRIGLDDLVAQSDDEYVALAVGLARDTDWRELIGERIELSRHRLLQDTAPIRALEDFLVEAVRAAAANESMRNGPA